MLIFLCSFLLATYTYATDIHVGNITNRLLMVDQDGKFNLPEVLATQAQLSSNQTAVVIASAKADAADRAAREGTNLVSSIIAQIASNELTVYRQGYIDSITSDVSLPPDTRCLIVSITPTSETVNGKNKVLLNYATSRNADGVDPDILFADTIAGGRDAMRPLSVDRIGAVKKLNKTFTGPDGSIFPYMYEIPIFIDPSSSGFFIVYLSGDQSAEGVLFEIQGGISGGMTTRVPFGDKTLVFRGGLLIGVEEVQ